MRITRFKFVIDTHFTNIDARSLSFELDCQGRVHNQLELVSERLCEQMSDDDFESVLDRLFDKAKRAFKESVKEFKRSEDDSPWIVKYNQHLIQKNRKQLKPADSEESQ